MQDPWSTVVSDTQLHPEYVEGRRFLRQGNLADALACFKAANQSTVDSHIHAALYMSYLGLTQVMLNDVSGLNLCRRAAQEEAHRGDVFENLARAELRMGHRKQACDALRRGLKVESGHTGLRELRTEMGVRRPPALGFLDRDNPLNRFLGKLTYRPRRKRTTGR